MNEPITSQQDHDRRIGRLEGIAEQLDRRLDSMERRLEGLERRLEGLERRLEGLERGQRWIISIQITTLIALGTLLFSILSKLPG